MTRPGEKGARETSKTARADGRIDSSSLALQPTDPTTTWGWCSLRVHKRELLRTGQQQGRRRAPAAASLQISVRPPRFLEVLCLHARELSSNCFSPHRNTRLHFVCARILYYTRTHARTLAHTTTNTPLTPKKHKRGTRSMRRSSFEHSQQNAAM